MRFTKYAMAGLAIAWFLVLVPARITLAATSAELADALDVDPQLVVSHNLFTINQTGSGSETLSGEVAADAFPSEGAILISNGLGADGGLGDTDRGNDGGREYTVFSINLQVPAYARTLAFRTRFVSREYKDGENLDKAMLSIGVEPCEFGCITTPYDLVSVTEAVDTTNPNLLRIVNVEGIDILKLAFTITDEGNGALDSAIRISDLHFSEDPSPSGAQLTSELQPEDVKVSAGTYRFQKTLFLVPGNGLPFEFSLHYNVAQTWSKTFGRKWSHNYEWRLARLESGGIHIRAGDGGSVYFAPPEAGTPDFWSLKGRAGIAAASFKSAWKGVDGSVKRESNGTYSYTDRSQRVYRFGATGLLTAMEDQNGNRLTVTHNDQDNVRTVTDTRGNRADFFYINQGRQLVSLIYETAAESRQFSFIYYAPVVNEAGEVQWDLLYFDEPGIGRTTFTYDAAGNMLTAIDADGRVIVDNRYAGETLVESADGKGLVDAYRYFSDSVEHTDRLGRIQTSVYDNQDRLRSQTDPLGNTSSFAYDAEGNLNVRTDPLGNSERRSYDVRSNLTGLTDALGFSTFYEYDARNNLTRIVDSLGYASDYVYDGNDNLTAQTDANGHATTFTHTDAGEVATITDPNGNIRSYTYSATGDVSSETDPLGGSVTYTYDDFGMPVDVVDENGNATSLVYDNAGRLTSVSDPLGNMTGYTLNSRGQRTTLIRANDTVTTYEYDANGRMTRLTDAKGNSFQSTFTAIGQLATQTDPLGRVTTLNYDDADRLASVADALGNSTTAGYDAAGRRTSITDPGGGITNYEHDALGRVVAETDALGNTIRNVYEERGLRTAIVTGRGQVITNSYDPGGRLVRTDYAGFTAQHTLDDNGNALRTVGSGGATITREFDGLNRLVSRTDPNGRTVRYEYDGVGNLTRLIYPDGRAVNYAYDAADRLVEVVDWADRRTAYTWDAVGNLTTIILPDGSVTSRAYDAVDRLSRQTITSGAGEAVFDGNYAYDPTGLRVTADVTYPLDPTTAPSPVEMTYDAANQLATVNGEAVEHDADGNMTRGAVAGEPITLEYDDRNRLLRAGTDAYRYDEDGYRIGAKLNGRSVEYTVDANVPLPRVLEEFDAEGNVIARYVYGLGLISRENAAGEYSAYHYDERGSTVALTDLTGTVTDRYAYGPWGRVAGRTGKTTNPFTYNGLAGVMDDGNGLYFMRARYYSPMLMRFVQRDPVFEGNLSAPQSLNRYAFALGNPIQLTDPDGESITVAVILIGVAVGVGGEIAWDTAFNGFDPLGGWNDAWAPYLEDNWVDLTIAGVVGAFTGPGGKIVQSMGRAKKLAQRAKVIRKTKKWATGSIKVFKRKAKHLRKAARQAFRKGFTWSFAESGISALLVYPALGIENLTSFWNDPDTQEWVDTAQSDVREWLGDRVTDAGNAISKGVDWVRSLF